MTTGQLETEFRTLLKSIYDDREGGNITDWVFENVTGLKKWQRKNQDAPLSDNDIVRLEKYLNELLLFRPVQYVLNEAWFYKRKFYVNEHTLIPRPETEELAEWIIRNAKTKAKDKIKIIDAGTGSGCIPISLKLEIPDAIVTSIDISDEALRVARKNAKELNAVISFLQMDFLQNSNWISLDRYDVIVSNPPYIPLNEKKSLSKNVADFEPEMALFVQDNDPLIFYRKIAEFAQSHLSGEGEVYVEVHEKFAQEVSNLFHSTGFYTTVKKDIYGMERMVYAQK